MNTIKRIKRSINNGKVRCIDANRNEVTEYTIKKVYATIADVEYTGKSITALIFINSDDIVTLWLTE